MSSPDRYSSVIELVRSHFSDLNAWSTGIATNCAVAGSLLVVGVGFVLSGVIVGLAAIFHWIEVTYSIYEACGIVGGSLAIVGALSVLIGLRVMKRHNPRVPLGERQIAEAKRAIVARLTVSPRRNTLATDPTTEILAGAATVILAGWVAASWVQRTRYRTRD